MHAHTHLHSYKHTHIHALIYACLPIRESDFSNVLSNKLQKSKSDIDITGFGLKNALSVLMLTLETKLAGFCVCAQK